MYVYPEKWPGNRFKKYLRKKGLDVGDFFVKVFASPLDPNEFINKKVPTLFINPEPRENERFVFSNGKIIPASELEQQILNQGTPPNILPVIRTLARFASLPHHELPNARRVYGTLDDWDKSIRNPLEGPFKIHVDYYNGDLHFPFTQLGVSDPNLFLSPQEGVYLRRELVKATVHPEGQRKEFKV